MMRFRRRIGEPGLAWHRPNLFSENALSLSSPDFDDGAALPLEAASVPAGGQNRSPELTWDALPAGTRQVLLVVEDVDADRRHPAVHCLALLDGQQFRRRGLEAGGLCAGQEQDGVVLLRSTFGRGYQGPLPAGKRAEVHRYVFQAFALALELHPQATGVLGRSSPQALLDRVMAPVIARGFITGRYEC